MDFFRSVNIGVLYRTNEPKEFFGFLRGICSFYANYGSISVFTRGFWLLSSNTGNFHGFDQFSAEILNWHNSAYYCVEHYWNSVWAISCKQPRQHCSLQVSQLCGLMQYIFWYIDLWISLIDNWHWISKVSFPKPNNFSRVQIAVPSHNQYQFIKIYQKFV